MDFLKAYITFCLRKKAEDFKHGVSPEDQPEVHHILPKCFNGSNGEDNKVIMTRHDHIIAHLLLQVALRQWRFKKQARKHCLKDYLSYDDLAKLPYITTSRYLNDMGPKKDVSWTFLEVINAMAFMSGVRPDSKDGKNACAHRFQLALTQGKIKIAPLKKLRIGNMGFSQTFFMMFNPMVEKMKEKRTNVPNAVSAK